MLLTAFKGKFNTSQLLLDGIHGDQIRKILLTNSFNACEREIREAIAACRPKHIISFGQKPLIDRLCIEPVACCQGDVICTSFAISLVEASLTAHGIPYIISENPSNYLCNHAYYHGLRYIAENELDTKMIFIHVPGRKNFRNLDKVAEWLLDFCRDRL